MPQPRATPARLGALHGAVAAPPVSIAKRNPVSLAAVKLRMRIPFTIPLAGTIALLFISCDRFIGEFNMSRSTRPPIAVADADYVILRPVLLEPSAGALAATVYGSNIYYQPSERIIDVRHLDLRTVQVQERSGAAVPEYAVSIHTTAAGAELLGRWTTTHLEQRLAVFLGGRLISAPFIKSAISEMIVLEGGFTKGDAENIANRLRRGGAA